MGPTINSIFIVTILSKVSVVLMPFQLIFLSIGESNLVKISVVERKLYLVLETISMIFKISSEFQNLKQLEDVWIVSKNNANFLELFFLNKINFS